MVKIKLDFPFLGEVQVKMDDHQLLEFTKRQLSSYMVDQTSFHKKKLESTVEIIVSNNVGISYSDVMLGRMFRFKNNCYTFDQESMTQRITYRYSFDKEINIKIDLNLKFLSIIKSLYKSNYSKNHLKFYQLVLYPLFSLFSIFEDYQLIHGSLLEFEGKVVVLSGLDGVGKSSLSAVMQKSGAKLLGDNFILFNGSNFFGLNMPIRLDKTNSVNENVVYENKEIKEVKFSSVLNKALEADVVYFLTISEVFSAVSLDNKKVDQNWGIINSGAGEVHEANYFIMPFLYMDMHRKKESSKQFVSFMLNVERGSLNKAWKFIKCQLNTL